MTPAVVSFAVAACLVFGLFGHCLGANILVLEGVPSPSHHIWMRTLTTELARLGHNVTSLSADVEADAPKNLHYIHLEKMYAMAEDSEMMEEFISMNDLSTWSKMFVFGDMFTIMLQGTVTSEGFTTLMNYPDDFPFDLIIYDTIAGLTSQVFVDKFKNVPVITVCPYPLVYFSNYISGSPYFPAFVPNQNALTLENTFCGRFENFLSALFEHFYIYNYLGYVMERDLNQVVKLSRPLKELYKRTKLVMPNYNPAVDLVQPIMPMVVPVGGLQIREPKPLPEDLDVIFRKAKMGVVLFSLGSNVKSEMLGVDRLTEIVEALRQFPEYDFIWKIDPTGMDLDIPKHVHIRKWLPQNDILAHNKTVLFMSHGGGLSTQETTWFGVPMLGFPVLMDQFPNVAKAVKEGMAIQQDVFNINRKSLAADIREMLTNTKYKQKALLRSKNFRDQPQTPLQRAIWHVEYVMRNPDISFLQNPLLPEMNVLVKHNVDVIAALTLISLGSVVAMGALVKCLVGRSKRASHKHKHKSL